jgi:hypothetical protein
VFIFAVADAWQHLVAILKVLEVLSVAAVSVATSTKSSLLLPQRIAPLSPHSTLTHAAIG